MRRSTYVVLIITSMCLFSCTKCNREGNSPISTWTVGTQSYKATSTTRSGGNSITAEDASGNGFQAFFTTLPTTGASYTIVDQGAISNHTLTNTQVVIEYQSGNDAYLSNGTGGATTQVIVAMDGTISFTLPSISVNHVNNGQVIGTTTASGYMTVD